MVVGEGHFCFGSFWFIYMLFVALSDIDILFMILKLAGLYMEMAVHLAATRIVLLLLLLGHVVTVS